MARPKKNKETEEVIEPKVIETAEVITDDNSTIEETTANEGNQEVEVNEPNEKERHIQEVQVEAKEEQKDEVKKTTEEHKFTKDEISNLPEVVMKEKVEPLKLSQDAEKWEKWLKMHGLSPEAFLVKYPNHPMRGFVKEIVDKKSN